MRMGVNLDHAAWTGSIPRERAGVRVCATLYSALQKMALLVHPLRSSSSWRATGAKELLRLLCCFIFDMGQAVFIAASLDHGA